MVKPKKLVLSLQGLTKSRNYELLTGTFATKVRRRIEFLLCPHILTVLMFVFIVLLLMAKS